MNPYKRTLAGVIGGFMGLIALSVVAALLIVTPFVPGLVIAGNAGYKAVSLFDGLPGYLEIDRLMLPTTIYAKDSSTGKDVELTTFYDQNRVPVEFDEVAPIMFDAVLSSEDPRYYEHGGIDIFGTTRALISNAQGGATQGGSSISQQYVKNVLVQRCERDAAASDTQTRDEVLQACWLAATNASGSDGYQRKLQEIRYAIELEQNYSKAEILLGYLNIANFGGTTYGIEAAARYYFGASAAKLSIGQAAVLAGIVQNPNTYRIDRPGGSIFSTDGATFNKAADGSVDDVDRGTLAALDTLLAAGTITDEQYLAAGDAYSATKGRQLYVLDRMREDGRITEDQFLAAAIEPISPKITPPHTGCVATKAPFFCQYVVNTVRSDPAYAAAFGETAQDRQRSLTREGLKIYTTLDWRLQNASQSAVSRYTPATVPGMRFGAASVSIEATTGRILAISQNNKFSEDAELTSSSRAYTSLVYAGDTVHGSSIGFPTGSTFKLFTLIDWLEQGHSLYESVNGNVRVIPRLADRCDGPWVNVEKAVVLNFAKAKGYVGTPMQFTAQSLNSGYLGMAEKLDLCDIEDVATRMGVTQGSGARVDVNGAAAIIGTNNIAPVAMAAAYATVANKGVYCVPRAIERVVNADGQEIPVPGKQCSRVLDQDIAAAAAFALQGVMNPGGTGYQGNPNDGTPMLGKTGTHEAFQTWLVESSTRVTTAAWVGNTIGTADLFRTWHNGALLSSARYSIARDIQTVANRHYGGGSFPAAPAEFLRRPYVAPPAQDSDDDAEPAGNNSGGNNRGNGNRNG
ncbi:transglycosylase domain-containing protein [Microbacterium thalassium]|uniref:Membrane peptidoglycan carboxypeptidase n=1 Tax=Microbacterium thalassium TaxID=362649 RepID=A0A7X0KW83_9MICO|nr:transglycosylase domain-containing protein [Microbacterium thalassium]MBB6392988.1 membrane peptidoglycan carboxypeptidase [Microbacterium thalassium]GLK22780.1 carboxypeptidase [Microbacterium thalassium]